MSTNELQERIRRGERTAFETLYREHARTVYSQAYGILNDRQSALAVVKQTFRTLYRELMQSEADVDVDARVAALSAQEIALQQSLSGAMPDLFASEPMAAPAAPAVPKQQEQLPVAAPEIPPLQRVQARMQADGETPHKGKRRAHREDAPPRENNGVVTVLIFVFLAIILWIAVGILMDLGVLNRIDLGFQWFNEHIFPLFQL